MTTAWRAAFRRLFTAWMLDRDGRGETPVVLTQRRIFILPTREGLIFAAVLFALFIASVNYNLNLGYVLTFLLASMGLTSMLHAFRNLARLEVTSGKADPVFAGESVLFHVNLRNPSGLARFAVGAKHAGAEIDFTDIAANRTGVLRVRIASTQRGWLAPGRLTLFTRYPLGLFYAWSNVQLDPRALVYPKPDRGNVPPPYSKARHERGKSESPGDDDFGGLKSYRPGDSPRHIAWKALARGQGLLTKQFAGPYVAELWLDWDALSGMQTEARLSRLTRWALDAHLTRASFGLRLPGRLLPQGSGERHFQEVLRALALFQLHD
jgi:uncharacterized protein (DUF58 family)